MDEDLKKALDVIEHCLLRWRNHTSLSRYGGRAADWKEAGEAIEGLELVRAWMARPQLKLFDLDK